MSEYATPPSKAEKPTDRDRRRAERVKAHNDGHALGYADGLTVALHALADAEQAAGMHTAQDALTSVAAMLRAKLNGHKGGR